MAAVTPTVDGDVLTVLAQVDEAFTPGQLHRVLSARSVEGIRKALNRLTLQGTVTSERVGSAYVYRLNRRHLAADAIIQLATMRRTLFTRLEDAIAAWEIQPIYGAVFGSAARGDMQTGSDIDLFLVHGDGIDVDGWELQVSRLKTEVTLWTGNDLRVLEYSECEVEGLAGRDPVLQSVAEEGLTVAGSPGWLRASLLEKRTG